MSTSEIFTEANTIDTNIQNNCYLSDSQSYSAYSYDYMVTRKTYYRVTSNPIIPSIPEMDIGWSSDLETNYNVALGFPLVGTDNGLQISVTDCSGFVSYVVEKTNSTAFNDLINNVNTLKTKPNCSLASLDGKHTQPWPSAADYAYFFDNIPPKDAYWEKVTSFDNLKTGDILAWVPADASQDTGHVMIVADVPTSKTESKIDAMDLSSISKNPLKSVPYYALPVIDSSSIIHHGADTRPSAGGLGQGTVWISDSVPTNTNNYTAIFNLSQDWFSASKITAGRHIQAL